MRDEELNLVAQMCGCGKSSANMRRLHTILVKINDKPQALVPLLLRLFFFLPSFSAP